MQFKSGTVVRFLSGFCALFAVAAAVVLRRGRGKRRGRGRRQKERRRRLAGKRPNMELYQRIEKPKEETRINDNEIRITSQGRMRNYITYATALLTVSVSLPLPCFRMLSFLTFLIWRIFGFLNNVLLLMCLVIKSSRKRGVIALDMRFSANLLILLSGDLRGGIWVLNRKD